MRRTSVRSRGASATTAWCERMLQGARNSGRVVATTSSGACAPRSASAWIRSSDVGSAQCRSSKARTTGCVLAPARSKGDHRGKLPLAQLFGAEFRARSAGSGLYPAAAQVASPFPGRRASPGRASSRGRRAAFRLQRPGRRSEPGPIPRLDAGAYSAEAATTSIQPRCAASHRAGSGTRRRAGTFLAPVRRQ